MRARVWFLFWAVVVIAGGFTFMTFLVNPIVVAHSKSKIEAMTIRAVNRAIAETVTTGLHRELTNISYGQNGRIIGVYTNTIQANNIAMEIAHAAQDLMRHFAAAGLAVPLGTFSGFPILTGRGPDVILRVVPVGSVYCDFDSYFVGQGINQTLHRIKLKVRTMVNLIMPLGSRNIMAEVEVLLCDNIIVGEVPQFYLAR